MQIRFWGVRGSIAAPGPETALVGGNTSSVEVLCGETRLLLDAGTGLRRLGDAMVAEGRSVDATILLSHFHWDHIQGLPFFVPAYVPTTRLEIVGPGGAAAGVKEAMARQMSAPHFPVGLGDLRASLEWRDVLPGEAFDVGEARVTAAKLNHPGGVLAYRIEHGGRAIVYATDTEHYACIDPMLQKLAEGADVLIYDAQYTPDEYAGKTGRSRVGWGHSTFVAGAEIARAASVKQLVLYHHDPQRSDAGVAAIEREAISLFENSVAAREGMVIDLAGEEPAPRSRAGRPRAGAPESRVG